MPTTAEEEVMSGGNRESDLEFERERLRIKRQYGMDISDGQTAKTPIEEKGKKTARGRFQGKEAIDLLTANRALVGLRKIRPSEEDFIVSNEYPVRKKWEYAMAVMHINEDGCVAVAPHMMERDVNIIGMEDAFAPVPIALSPFWDTSHLSTLIPIECHRYGKLTKIEVASDFIPPLGDATTLQLFIYDTKPILITPPLTMSGVGVDCVESDLGKIVFDDGVPIGRLKGYVNQILNPVPPPPLISPASWEIELFGGQFAPVTIAGGSAMTLGWGGVPPVLGTGSGTIAGTYSISGNFMRTLYRKTLAPAAVGDMLIEEVLDTKYTAKNKQSISGLYPNILWAVIRMTGGISNDSYGFRIRLDSESRMGDIDPQNIPATVVSI